MQWSHGPESTAAAGAIRSDRSGEQARRVPLIALSAHADAEAEAARLCVEAGMDGLAGKPVDFGELDALIERAVAARSALPSPEGIRR